MINGSLVIPYVYKSKLPWHIIVTIAFVIGSNSHLNISIDAWKCEVYQPQKLFTVNISEESKHLVCDKLEKR